MWKLINLNLQLLYKWNITGAYLKIWMPIYKHLNTNYSISFFINLYFFAIYELLMMWLLLSEFIHIYVVLFVILQEIEEKFLF